MVKNYLYNVDILPSDTLTNLNVGLPIRKLLGNHVGVVDPQPDGVWVGFGRYWNAWFILTLIMTP